MAAGVIHRCCCGGGGSDSISGVGRQERGGARKADTGTKVAALEDDE